MPMTLVSTCRAYAPKTLPRLCASLRRAGAKYTIVGDGFDEPTLVEGELVQPAPVAGLWDLTALPYATRLREEWFFLMADTCEVDEDYVAKISRFTDWQYDLVGLVPECMLCFLGLYHQSYIANNARRIAKRAGMTKRELVLFEISQTMQAWAKMYRHVEHIDGEKVEYDQRVDVYGVGRPRWRRYFPAFGLTKWTVARIIEEVSEERARQL